MRTKRGELGARGHEAGDRGRGALVGVGRPRVERHGADLEEQADDAVSTTPGSEGPGGRPTRVEIAVAMAFEVGWSPRSRRAARPRRGRTRVEKAPRRKYFSAASCDEQAAAAGQTGHGRTAGARGPRGPTNSVMRSLAAEEDHHAEHREQRQREDLGGREPGADRGVLLVAPGVEAPMGVKASEPTPPKRSAKMEHARSPRAGAARPGGTAETPSMATEPLEGDRLGGRAGAATSAAKRRRAGPDVRTTCAGWRERRGANASTRTPTMAPRRRR